LLASSTWVKLLTTLEAGLSAVSYSLLFATLTASVVVGFALLTWRWPLQLASWISFLIPGVLLGLFLIWLLNRPPLTAVYQSIGVVVLAFAVRYLAPGWNVVSLALKTTDGNLTDVAQMEGASRWQLFRHVQLPQIFPQLCVAWYVTYLFCLWDVEALILIVPPGTETLALRIFNLLHYGHNSEVNALCVLLLGLAVLPLICFLAAADVRRLIINMKISAFARRLLQVILLAPVSLLVGCSFFESDQTGIQISSKFFSSVEIIGSRGTGLGQFNKPRSLALDTNDNLFVVDMTGRVQKFSSNGIFLTSWQMPQTDLGKPKGMCRDSDGNIVVIEPHYARVNHFSSDGKLLHQWGWRGTNAGELAFPRAIAANSRGEMLVSEYALTERVQHFSSDGKTFLNAIGKPGD
jgi:ABC-type spermidine/putrescine transport system permease subunit II